MSRHGTAAAAAQPGGDASNDSHVRRAGRQLIFNAYGALAPSSSIRWRTRRCRRRSPTSRTRRRSCAPAEGELELRMSGEFIFINQTRLRLDLDNFASFSHLLSLFRAAGIGTRRDRERDHAERLADLSLVAAGAWVRRSRGAPRGADREARAAPASPRFISRRRPSGRGEPREGEGAREAHVRAVRRRHARPHVVRAHGRAARTSRR